MLTVGFLVFGMEAYLAMYADGCCQHEVLDVKSLSQAGTYGTCQL